MSATTRRTGRPRTRTTTTTPPSGHRLMARRTVGERGGERKAGMTSPKRRASPARALAAAPKTIALDCITPIQHQGCDSAREPEPDRRTRAAGSRPYSGGVEALTPAQQHVLDGLMAAGQPRPSFDADLGLRLLDLLEDGLGPVADRLGDHVINVNKAALNQIHQCESHHVAAVATPFAWSPAAARGTIAHRALQMGAFRADDPSPLGLVDDVIEALVGGDDEWSPGQWLRAAPPQDVAEVRADASAAVTAFQECFPPLKPSWKPRMEFPVRAELCADRIRLRSKVDLALGSPRGTEARTLIIDFKTGRPWGGHLDDLRYYALLDTLRVGVPPFRVATYYLDAGRWHHEDMTEDLLTSAARRVVAGVTRIAELHLGDREPAITPCGACSYCGLRDRCDGAVTWKHQRENDETGLFPVDPDDDDDGGDAPLPF